MMQRGWGRLLLLGLGVSLGVTLAAQGDLSEQVLRLLTRDNTWSGTNIYARTVGIELERASVPVADPTDRLENRGGNLYFNDVLVAPSAGVGTVTSVGLTVPSILSVSGSPVTSSGTLAVTLATETANTVFAGPTTGSAATPTFRTLVDADVPNDITISCTGCVTWASVSKTASSLADLATRSASDLSSGTLPDARFPATLPAASGVNLTALNATNLGSGTVPAARLPAFTGGDVTSSAGTVVLTLANTAVTAGSYTAANITVDAKGRITAAANGSVGTGTVTHTAGNLTASAVMVGNGSADSKVLASLGTTTTVLHGNAAGLPTWAAITLTTDVTGILPPANGGTGDSTVPSNGFIPIGNGTTYTSAAVTGTANQVVVTNGSGSITLSTPQSIGTTSTPQFSRIGLGTGAGGTAVITTTGIFNVGLFDNGNCGAAATITWTSGMVEKTTLNDATCVLTFSAPTAAGTWFTLEVIQDGVGGRLVTWPGTVVWEGGVAPTLSTAASSKDVCSFLYDGSVYIGRCLVTT